MDLKTLKAQHLDTYEAAAVDGEKRERDRVMAHLTLGQQGGPEGMAIALKAIESGDGLTMTTNAKYLNVAMNRRDRDLRQQDSDAAGAAADGAARDSKTASKTGDEESVAGAWLMVEKGKVTRHG